MQPGAVRVVCAGLVSLAGFVACSSDDDAAESTVAASAVATTVSAGDTVATTDAGPQRLYSGPLAPGTYAGNLFEHPVTLTVGEGWRSEESFGTIGLREVLPEDSTVEIGGGLAIIDVVSEMSAEEVLTRLVDREGITFSEPEPTSIAGLDGVVVTADPPPQDVIYRFIQDSQGVWYTPTGQRSEVHVVEAPTGTRLVWIEAPPERWQSFRPAAQTVIDSIVWSE